MALYTVFICDENKNRIKQIAFSNISAVMRYSDISTWTLQTWINEIDTYLDYKSEICIDRDGVEFLSGPILLITETFTGGENTVTLSGTDQLGYLMERYASSTPSGPPYTDAEDTRLGPIESLLKDYVSYNAGPDAELGRRVPGFTIETDMGRGFILQATARFDNLLGFLQSIALQGGDVGFRIVGMEFQYYEPRDKTGTIVFSRDLGNILQYDYAIQRPTGNYILAGGGGEGASRTFMEKGNWASINSYGRVEAFLDKQNITDITELDSALTEELSKQSEIVSVVVTVSPTANVTAYDDYWLGDYVSVVIRGVEILGNIREIKFDYTPGSLEIFQPVISTVSGARKLTGFFDKLRNIDARLKKIETRR